MRWIPTKFALWPAGAVISRSFTMRGHGRDAGILAIRVMASTAGLILASTSSAGELAAVSSGPATGHWPWIAVAAILGLLGVVSFVSRRRIHAVVGS